MLNILSRFKVVLLYVGLCGFFCQTSFLSPSTYMMMVFDRVIPCKSVSTLALSSLQVFFLLLVMMVLDYLCGRLMVAMSADVDKSLGQQLIDALLAKSLTPGLHHEYLDCAT